MTLTSSYITPQGYERKIGDDEQCDEHAKEMGRAYPSARNVDRDEPSDFPNEACSWPTRTRRELVILAQGPMNSSISIGYGMHIEGALTS
jgi:hypothetical protein